MTEWVWAKLNKNVYINSCFYSTVHLNWRKPGIIRDFDDSQKIWEEQNKFVKDRQIHSGVYRVAPITKNNYNACLKAHLGLAQLSSLPMYLFKFLIIVSLYYLVLVTGWCAVSLVIYGNTCAMVNQDYHFTEICFLLQILTLPCGKSYLVKEHYAWCNSCI